MYCWLAEFISKKLCCLTLALHDHHHPLVLKRPGQVHQLGEQNLQLSLTTYFAIESNLSLGHKLGYLVL